jgi:hypothetical protein
MDVLADVLERAAGILAQQGNDSSVDVVQLALKFLTPATFRR